MTRRRLLLGGITTGAAALLTASERRLAAARRIVPPPRAHDASIDGAARMRRGTGQVEALEAAVGPPFASRPDLDIPGLEVALSRPAATPGLILLAPYNAPHPSPAGGLIADDRGRPLWERPRGDLITADLRVQTYRGEPVLTWWEGDIELGHGVGSYVIADLSYRPIAHLGAGNGYRGDLHEFLLTDRNTALLTSYAVTATDLRSVGGQSDGTIQDALFQEVDLASGRVLLEWRSLDHIPITESFWPLSADWDYVHLNSIDVDRDQNLLISARNTHTVYKIDRRSGEIMWRLGGRHSDFEIPDDAGFAWQHDARRQADGTLSMFDNGYRVSRALLLSVDESTRRVSVHSSYRHPDNLYALSQGNVQLLPNGNVFVGWGAQPYVSEFTRSGELVFDAKLASGYISYRAYRAPWTAGGDGPPAVLARRRGSHTDVYVSWNGDTRASYWQALAGTSRRSLESLGAVERTGFETAMRIPAEFTQLSLAAVDAFGTTLTVTPPIAV